MKKRFLVLSTGFALFSMFFGSGNLVFPLLVGQQSGGHFLLGALGIILTGVLVPFLGSLGIMLYEGSRKNFFSSLGSIGTFIFSLIALSLMGPFGVMPRCLTVAHGAIQTLLPSASLVLTSLIFCGFIYLMIVNKNKVVPLLGSVLTPLLLAAIAAIAFFSVRDSSSVSLVKEASLLHGTGGWDAFKNGFIQGYQTLDLLAAFFFSAFIIDHLKSVKTQDVCGSKLFLRSALIGAGILSGVYLVLVLLGSLYAPLLQGALPQQMLGKIAIKSLGSFGAPVLCVLVVLACFTTAIVLVSLFAEFLRKEIFKEKIESRLSILITLGIGFLVSILGFGGIAKILGPVVEVIYPALIVMTVVNIGHKCWGLKNSHWPITFTLAAKIGLLRFI